MPASQIIGFSNLNPSGIHSGVTRAVVLANTLNTDNLANEEYPELPVREAGVLDQLYTYVDLNSLNGSTVFSIRKNRADTLNISITIGAGQTGAFSDTTNSESLAASDEVTGKVVTGGTSGAFNARMLAWRFVPTDSTKTIAWDYSGGSGGGINVDNVTRYWPITGTISVDANETFAQGYKRSNFTARNLVFQVASNARTTSCTVRTRKNLAFGNQTVTVGAGQMGVFEDLTNTDALVAGDEYNYSITTLSGGGLINSRRISTTLVSTANQWTYGCGNINSAALVAPTDLFAPFAGNLAQASSTEAIGRNPTFAQTVRNLAVRISSNNASASLSVRTRWDGSNGTCLIGVSAGQSGLFEDPVNSDSIPDGALAGFILDSAGGSGKVVFRMISLQAET